MVVVHIDSPEKVDSEVANADGYWEVRCSSPCDCPIAPGELYRITGEGIRDSHSFHLEPGNRTTLHVEPTSSGARAGAVVITILGFAGLAPAVGVSTLIVGGELLGLILICPLAAAFETDKSKQSSEYGTCLGDIATYFSPAYLQPWVWVPGFAGAALLTGGVVWLTQTGATSVTQAGGWPGRCPPRPACTRSSPRSRPSPASSSRRRWSTRW